MKFEESFPSLKDKVFRDTQGFDMVTDFNIEEHCLDKQKVRDVIDKVFLLGPRSWRATKRKIQLLKELGLEK